MEKCFEFNTDLHILFVDYKQAFDSVNRVELLNIMEGYGIPKKLIRLVDMTMKESNARITIAGNVSNALNITQGVRQGDGLSAVLFNLALNKALEELKLKGNILNKSKQACVYADDIALIARNLPALQEMLTTLTETGKQCGLCINEEKTKYMKMTVNKQNVQNFTTNISIRTVYI